MKKIKSLPESKLNEISSLIGASFWDYPYEAGEGGLKAFLPTRKAMDEYMKALVVAGIESCTFFSTDGGEGYILITDSQGAHPNLRSTVKMIRGMKKAIGGWRKLFRFLKQTGVGDETLESRMKKQKKPYIKVEMLIVTKEFQRQGYMRKLVEFAFSMADKKGCACILDTDAKGKCDRYIHLGMRLERTRQTAGFKLYDLIYEPKKRS
ncbi:MAG: GNAT family N-acetyltransferase [Ruminococcus sp.]|nr:GNAT family N-acetyltransferase [Ruminococcus sp.]